MSTHPIQPASDPPPPLVPREWRLRLDPLLLLATLGLVAVSLIAMAVWFPVTMLTLSGVSNTRASYLDVAKTLPERAVEPTP